MELLFGQPLSDVLRDNGRLDFGEACTLMAQVALATPTAHDAGIIHGDLEPDGQRLAVPGEGE